MGGDQHHIAFARHDAPAHGDAGGTAHGGIGVPKPQPAGQRVGICHAQGGGGKTCGVDDGAGTDRDARLVHQHQATIRAQGAKYLRWGVGDNPVDGQAARAGLYKVGAAARRNGETLPVDRRVAGAGAVLGGDGEFVADTHHAGLADNGDAATGVGAGCTRQCGECGSQGQGEHGWLQLPLARRHDFGLKAVGLGHRRVFAALGNGPCTPRARPKYPLNVREYVPCVIPHSG